MEGREPGGVKIVALIPARGGSKRIPRKNLAVVGGVTLLERAIRVCQDSRRIVETYVSSEDTEIQNLALAAGAQLVVRPRYLGDDDSRTDDVMRHFLQWVKLDPTDIVVLVEPTAPLRTPDDLDAIADLMKQTNAPAARMVHVDRFGCHGEVYRDVGLAQAIRVGAFGTCLFPQGTLLLHDGDERALDVNTPDSLTVANLVVA